MIWLNIPNFLGLGFGQQNPRQLQTPNGDNETSFLDEFHEVSNLENINLKWLSKMTGWDVFRIFNWTEIPSLTLQVLSLETIRAKILNLEKEFQ